MNYKNTNCYYRIKSIKVYLFFKANFANIRVLQT